MFESVKIATSKRTTEQDEMNDKQKAALKALAEAMSNAMDVGALDVLVAFTKSPDSINDICDALTELPEKG
jgi:hypothetical protein